MRNLEARVYSDVVVIAPLVDAHLLADNVLQRRRAVIDVLAFQHFVNADRGVMAMRSGPNNVLRPKRSVAAKEHPRVAGLERDPVDLGHVPALVPFQADIALDPGEGILLANGAEHVVALVELIRLARRHQPAATVVVVLRVDLLEDHADQLAGLQHKGFRHQHVEDRDILALGIFLLPGRRLHLVKAGPHDHLHALATQPAGGAAAIHGGVATAQHDDALADRGNVAERDGGEPFDADMEVRRGFLAARNIQVAATRRTGADEHGVPVLIQYLFQGVDAFVDEVDVADAGDVIDLLVDHLNRQAEVRNLRPHHAAQLRVLIEQGDLIAQHSQIARDGQRGRPGAQAGNLAPVGNFGRLGHAGVDVVLIVGGHALQAADCHRLLAAAGQVLVLHPATAARRFARAVAGAAQNSGEDVRLPVEHIGVGKAAMRDHPDIFRHWRMGGTGPLAIHNFMEVVWIGYVSRLQTMTSRS